MVIALFKAVRRQKKFNMTNQSKPCLDTNIVAELELDDSAFHMEFHTILQGLELCLPDGKIRRCAKCFGCANEICNLDILQIRFRSAGFLGQIKVGVTLCPF